MPRARIVPYEEFRTGLTFGEVRQMLWSYSDDRSTWRHKRRNTVLGYWRELKLAMYDAEIARLRRQKKRAAARAGAVPF